VDTRLGKLESEELQAIILATAGLKRLGFASRVNYPFPEDQILPAIGQGALGLEVRREDGQTRDHLSFLNDEATEVVIRAERAFLRTLEGGCQVPVAALASLNGETLSLQGLVAELDGTTLIRDSVNGQRDRPEEAGVLLGKKLLESGAEDILRRIYAGRHQRESAD
jgi:hydroxymethylbilane synthase